MENQLIRTDGMMYKIKRFFRSFFFKRNSNIQEEVVNPVVQDINIELDKVISCKTEAQEKDIKEQLAQKLMKNELSIKDLADSEVEEMIQYFKADLKCKSEELANTKKLISELKKRR